jgi:hypothetical protein
MTDSTISPDPVAAAAAIAPPPAAPAMPANLAELARRTPGVVPGARWFWWIAGLSLVNLVCALSHANFSFVMGLAFTQIAHAVFRDNLAVAFLVDALFIGGFFVLGRQAQRGQPWAFAVGICVYLCDALIYLKYTDLMPVAFHALALFYLVKAAVNLRVGQKLTGLR